MAGATYWIGQDGNIYFGSGQEGAPVQNYGAADGSNGGQYRAEGNTLVDRYADYAGQPGSRTNATRIDDPALGGGQVLGQTTGGGAQAAPAKVLNQAAVDNTNKAIGSLGREQEVGYQNIEDDYGSVVGRYDLERKQNRNDFDEGNVTNNQNLQKNRQSALVSAAQGLRGLRGVLGSIGALGGDGATLANRAVTTEANQDLGGAQDTASTNARGLDRAWGKFDEEDDQRRAEASTNRTNSRTALEGSIAGKRQGLLQKLAGLFGDVDNTGEATKYLDQAGDLNSTIAEKSRVQAAPIVGKGAAFSPGELETYLAGNSDMTVSARKGGIGAGGPTAVLAGRDGDRDDERRKKLEFATV